MATLRRFTQHAVHALWRRKRKDLALSSDEPTKSSFYDYFISDLGADTVRLLKMIRREQWSMTSDLNLVATALACQHVVSKNIPGDFVECGVWRGGQALLAAGVFANLGSPRRVFLFDTFSGMPEPEAVDVRTADGMPANNFYKAAQRQNAGWCFASLEEVKTNFEKAGVSMQNVVFVKGKIEHTLTSEAIVADLSKGISVLRLDTDWYSSTKRELEVLWPRLSNNGLLIVDDYGYWSGARKAVDEFFGPEGPFLSPLGESARLVTKTTS